MKKFSDMLKLFAYFVFTLCLHSVHSTANDTRSSVQRSFVRHNSHLHQHHHHNHQLIPYRFNPNSKFDMQNDFILSFSFSLSVCLVLKSTIWYISWNWAQGVIFIAIYMFCNKIKLLSVSWYSEIIFSSL